MLYAKLELDNTLYVFLHAEQVYRNFKQCDKDLGYFTHEITEDTVSEINKYIEGNTTCNNIVIDCDEIDEAHNIAEWIEKIIKNCTDNNKNLTFCRMSESLYAASKIHGKKLTEKSVNNKTNVYTQNTSQTSITDEDIFGFYERTLVNNIKSSYIEDGGYSHSSNVVLPKYINIKKFIEEKEISFLGLYLLCKKAVTLNLINGFMSGNRRPLLFFSSMAGSYLASVFSKLACIDMVFINHLGPKKKLYRELHKEQLLSDRDYLIISDVVCLGAEIERAKTLIEHVGGKLKGILSVVFVEVVSDRPKTNEIHEVSLLALTRKNNLFDYQIITDFPPK